MSLIPCGDHRWSTPEKTSPPSISENVEPSKPFARCAISHRHVPELQNFTPLEV